MPRFSMPRMARVAGMARSYIYGALYDRDEIIKVLRTKAHPPKESAMRLPPPPSYAPAYCNDQYDNRNRVADVPAILVRWKNEAQHARAELGGEIGLAYGPGAAEKLDLFQPRGRGGDRMPLLVFIHGGYWRSLSKSDFSWIAPPFVARGTAVAILDYGLAPATPLETIVRQNLSAIAWLWHHAARFGLAQRRIVVAGHSAGGHLAAMMLAARWPQFDACLPKRTVHAAVAVSGLYDMEPLRHAPYLNADLQLTLDRVAPLSPLYMTPASDAPLVTAVGDNESDEFKRHAREIGLAWRSVLRENLVLSGADHFTACEALADPGHALFRATQALCAS